MVGREDGVHLPLEYLFTYDKHVFFKFKYGKLQLAMLPWFIEQLSLNMYLVLLVFL